MFVGALVVCLRTNRCLKTVSEQNFSVRSLSLEVSYIFAFQSLLNVSCSGFFRSWRFDFSICTGHLCSVFSFCPLIFACRRHWFFMYFISLRWWCCCYHCGWSWTGVFLGEVGVFSFNRRCLCLYLEWQVHSNRCCVTNAPESETCSKQPSLATNVFVGNVFWQGECWGSERYVLAPQTSEFPACRTIFVLRNLILGPWGWLPMTTAGEAIQPGCCWTFWLGLHLLWFWKSRNSWVQSKRYVSRSQNNNGVRHINCSMSLIWLKQRKFTSRDMCQYTMTN